MGYDSLILYPGISREDLNRKCRQFSIFPTRKSLKNSLTFQEFLRPLVFEKMQGGKIDNYPNVLRYGVRLEPHVTFSQD